MNIKSQFLDHKNFQDNMNMQFFFFFLRKKNNKTKDKVCELCLS